MLDISLSENHRNCLRMIARQALWTMHRVSAEHRRWIGLDDLIQDGHIAALEAEKKYRPLKGASFPTFLYNALTFHYNHELTRLRQLKRMGQVVELDAPIGDSHNRYLDLPDETMREDESSLYPGNERDAIRSFLLVCKRLEPEKVIWFIGLLLTHAMSWQRKIPINSASNTITVQAISDAVGICGMRIEDFRTMMQSVPAVKSALINLAKDSSIGLGTEMDARVLECISCQGRFALAAIRSGRYMVDTLTCTECYRKMQQADPVDSCFGKPKVNGHEGYSEQDIECTLHCKDRKVCRQYVEDEERMLMKDSKKTKKVEETETTAVAEPEVEAPAKKKKIAAAVEAPEKPKKKVKITTEVEEEEAPVPKKSKASKEEKPEKAAKAAPKEVGKAAKESKASSNGDAPKDVVRWPHKTGSWMQYCFRMAYRGVKAAELEAEVTKEGRKWPIFLKVLRGGKSGMKRPTHTWKLDESGGRLKIHDVKYLGGKEA